MADRLKVLKDWYNGLNSREKLFVALGAGGVIAILFWNFVLASVGEWHDQVREDLEMKIKEMQRYYVYISDNEKMNKLSDKKNLIGRELENRFLSGENPELAAAELQQIIKSIAQDLSIEINRISTKTPREREHLTEVSVEFPQVRMTVRQMRDFLIEIEKNKKLLFVVNMDISVVSPARPLDKVSATLTVTGLIPGGKAEKSEEKA